MKMLGIVCSPRKGGNTEILIREALEAVREGGVETELFLVADKQISPCRACETCFREGACCIQDDMQELYCKLDSADGVIIGSPVYFNNVSAQTKIIMDRTFALLKDHKLKDKVASAIVAVRRVGGQQTLSLFYSYFIAQRMIVVKGGIGYGREKGDVRQGVGGMIDCSALEEAREVGTNVMRLIKRLEKRKV